MSEYRISCVVNNCTKLSSHFWGEHGLSFFIETPGSSFFFDTGQSYEVLSRNISLLNINLYDVNNIIISHGHYDHTGGLSWLISKLNHPTVFADPDIFIKKYSIRNDEKKDIGIPVTRQNLENHAILNLSTSIVELYPDVFISGRIPRTNSYETGDIELFTHDKDQTEKLIQDPVLDDRCIIIKTEKGVILLLGCCHSGIINTLTYVSEYFSDQIHAVIGGAHMASISPERRNFTVAKIKQEFRPNFLYLNHCTGSEIISYMKMSIGYHVMPCPVGTVLQY